jgi:hypothetical protein
MWAKSIVFSHKSLHIQLLTRYFIAANNLHYLLNNESLFIRIIICRDYPNYSNNFSSHVPVYRNNNIREDEFILHNPLELCLAEIRD